MKYIVGTPKRCEQAEHFATACKIAMDAERAAQSAHGPQAGADCYLVSVHGEELEFRGLIVGRTTIGQAFGCADSVLNRARQFLAT